MFISSALGQNWVGCTVCTPKDPGCAHAAHALHPGCALGAVSCRRPPCRNTKLYCDVEAYAELTVRHITLAQRRVAAPCRTRTLSYRSTVARCIATQMVTPLSRYKNFIMTQNPCRTHYGPCCARCAQCLACLRSIVGRWAPCRRPCRDIKAAPPPRYKILYRDAPHWPGSARCPRHSRKPAVSQHLLAVSWGYVVGLLAVLWLPAARPYAPVSRYSLLHEFFFFPPFFLFPLFQLL